MTFYVMKTIFVTIIYLYFNLSIVEYRNSVKMIMMLSNFNKMQFTQLSRGKKSYILQSYM